MFSRFLADYSRKTFLFLLPFIFSILIYGCSGKQKKVSKAEEIIEKAIKTHGGSNYKKARIHFDFRDKHYITTLNGGAYRYVRQYSDSTGRYREVLTNDSIYRKVNGEKVPLTRKEESQISGSLNSVNYFYLLPYHLNDKPVLPKYLGTTTIKGEPYHKIKVTFNVKANNTDHEDIYLYWFHRKKHTMDYLAYKFFVNDGGMRFRVAENPRNKGGIRFQDYLNLKPEAKSADFTKIDSLYEAGELRKVSEINKRNIKVKSL